MNTITTSLNFLADSGGLDPSTIIDTIKPWVNIAMSIIFGLLGLFCAVKCAIIGFHIAKSADNAEQRSEYVRSLIWPIVGLLAAVIIPTVVTVILQQVQAAQIGG